jgi:hypothetical protein
MDPQAEAYEVLSKHGIDPEQVETNKELANIIRNLPKEDALEVVNAFKFLRGREVWKTDSKNSAILKNNYTDINFFKKRIWELSGHDNHELTIWIYGKGVIKKIVVMTNFKMLPEIIKAAKIYYPPVEAVIFSGKAKIMFLAYANGHTLSKPIRMNDTPFVNDPGQHFISQLQNILHQLVKKEKPVAFKAWFNTKSGETKQVKQFAASLKDNPEAFGIQPSSDMTLVNMRVKAENNGWVAIGVGKDDKGNNMAFVQSMNNDQLKASVEKLYDLTYHIQSWDYLQLKSNFMDKTLDRNEITEFFKKIGIDLDGNTGVQWV